MHGMSIMTYGVKHAVQPCCVAFQLFQANTSRPAASVLLLLLLPPSFNSYIQHNSFVGFHGKYAMMLKFAHAN